MIRKKFYSIFMSLVLLFSMLSYTPMVSVKASQLRYGDYTYQIQTNGSKEKYIYITGYSGKGVNIVLPSQINNIKVTTISEDLFKNNDLVKSITLSKNIKDVYGRYFKEINHLEELKAVKENPYYTSSDGVLFDKNKRELVCYPRAKTNKNYSIPSTVKEIQSDAFANNSSLEKIVCNKLMDAIPDDFAAESNIKTIEMGKNIQRIGERAFYKCKKLKAVNLSKGLKYIDDEAFRECTALTSIKLPSKLKNIRFWAFRKCKLLKKITIPDSVTFIETCAFEGCPAKLKKPSYLKKNKWELGGYEYRAIAAVKIPRKGKDKKVKYRASKITKITTLKKNIKLKKGKKKKIYTRIYVSKKKKQGYLDYSILKFTSSNKKVVKVSKYGNIKALKKGKATITVKLRTSGKSYRIKVRVTK